MPIAWYNLTNNIRRLAGDFKGIGRQRSSMKKVNLLGKINYIFDRKQKIQLGILGVMIFIGGLLETLGVGAMIPLVNALLMPEKLQEFINRYDILKKICDALQIENAGQITMTLLIGLMAIYVIKNLYILRLSRCLMPI